MIKKTMNNLLETHLCAIVVVLCVLIALNLFELFSSSYIPPGDDSRAHIYRIAGFLSEYILNTGFSLKQYNGMVLLNYAPLFYAIAYPFSYLIGSIHSYNLCRVLTLIFYTVSLLFLAVEAGIDRRRSLLIIPIVVFFPTLWIVYYKGAFPYLLSWGFTIASTGLVLLYSSSQRIEHMVLSAVVGGLSILAHSYGLINIVLPATLLLVVTTKKSWKKGILLTATYTVIILGISSGYLLSMLTMYKDSSPLHEVSPFAWVPGLYIEFLGIDIVTLTMLIVSIVILMRILFVEKTNRPSFVVFWGLILYTSIALLQIALTNINVSEPTLIREITSFIMPWRFLLINNAAFISIYIGGSKQLASISTCKLSMLLFIKSLLIAGLIASIIVTKTVAPYEKPIDVAFPGFTSIVKGGRVLVVGTPLILSNSPVAFSILYNYTTSTGSYNQGDPAFFDLTVYYEWVNNLLINPVILSNIVELTRSKYIFTDLDIYVGLTHINTTSYSCKFGKVQEDSEVVECTFDNIVEFNEFSGIKVELTNYPSDFVKAVAILVNNSEVELEPVKKLVNSTKTSFILQLHCPNRCRYGVYGVKLHIRKSNSILGIDFGVLNLRKITTYEYRGHQFNLYEYNGDPSLAICSKLVVFDTQEFNPKLINLMAREGHKAMLVEGMPNISKELIAGAAVDSSEKAAKYLKEGYKTLLLTRGEKFLIRKVDTNFVHVETPLLDEHILPYDPGNPWSYLKWDKSLSHDKLMRVVDEASKLWSFIVNYMNITVEPCNAYLEFNPPELHIEVHRNVAFLVKVAYTSHWKSSVYILRSTTGFLVAVPFNSVSSIHIVWNPPYVDVGYRITATSIALTLLYVSASSLIRKVRINSKI